MVSKLDSAVFPTEHEIKQETKTKYTSVLSRAEVRELVAKYDWDVEIMTAIFMAESSGSTTVVNHKDNHRVCIGSYGLAQIGCLHVDDPEKLKDPVYNIEIAYMLWKRDGINIWGSFTDKRYLKFMI